MVKKKFYHIAVGEEVFKEFKKLKGFQESDEKVLIKLIKGEIKNEPDKSS